MDDPLDLPPPDGLGAELAELLAEVLPRTKPDPWPCPLDGEPLRQVTTTLGRHDEVAWSPLAPTGSTYVHRDGTTHGELGTTVHISWPDGTFTAYDVLDERVDADGVQHVEVRPRR